jgi:hypothetical protein
MGKSKYNAPRVGKKRWSTGYKKKINCSNPRGFSQKQYCKRKSRGGKYKEATESFQIIKDLIKIANHLDSKFLKGEADIIDHLILEIYHGETKDNE